MLVIPYSSSLPTTNHSPPGSDPPKDPDKERDMVTKDEMFSNQPDEDETEESDGDTDLLQPFTTAIIIALVVLAMFFALIIVTIHPVDEVTVDDTVVSPITAPG